jgi:hypothetical protein
VVSVKRVRTKWERWLSCIPVIRDPDKSSPTKSSNTPDAPDASENPGTRHAAVFGVETSPISGR